LTAALDDAIVVVGRMRKDGMESLPVPGPLRVKLGDAASDGLLTMFADAHRLAVESFERRLDQNTALLTERFERRLAEQTSILLKWCFLFWIGQLAAMAGMLSLVLPRG
jgi:hypothetical protein